MGIYWHEMALVLAVTRAGKCKSVSGHEGFDEASFKQGNTSDWSMIRR
jgi:hypothetical protein